MDPHKSDSDLAQLFDELFPVPEGVKVPMPRFGRMQPPPAQALPSTGPLNQPLAPPDLERLDWLDSDLGINVFIKYQGDSVWAFVEGDEPALAGKSASVALVSEKGDRFLSRLVPLERDDESHCSGQLSFGTIDEVRRQLGSEKITLDVFLIE